MAAVMAIERRNFADRNALAAALAETVATQLKSAIGEGGEASIAVSGGSTPEQYFNILSQVDVEELSHRLNSLQPDQKAAV